jgi:hypothetical protein
MYALPTLALLLPLLLPSTAPVAAHGPTPNAAADKDCAESVVEIDVNVETGTVQAFDGERWTTLDRDLVVRTGDLSRVAVEIRYSTGEWIASASADGAMPVRVATLDGALRVWLDADTQRLVISSTARAGASAMLAMTPVVPDVIIRPIKTCPPPP